MQDKKIRANLENQEVLEYSTKHQYFLKINCKIINFTNKSNSTDQSMFFKDIGNDKGESVMVSKELLYLNNKPKYNYLKEESRIRIRVAGDKSLFKRTNFHDKQAVHKIFSK